MRTAVPKKILNSAKAMVGLFLGGLGSESVGIAVPNSSYDGPGWPKAKAVNRLRYLFRLIIRDNEKRAGNQINVSGNHQ